MVVLITYEEENKYTKGKDILVSHGVDADTLQTVMLPNVFPTEIGYFNKDLQEWILRE